MTISVAGFNPGLYLLRITDLVTGKIISREFLKKIVVFFTPFSQKPNNPRVAFL